MCSSQKIVPVDYSQLNYICFTIRKLSLLIAVIYSHTHAFPPSNLPKRIAQFHFRIVLTNISFIYCLLFCFQSVQYTFRRDLRWCPTFSKLKTLVLNDYSYESTDCSALACMLQHAPVLEKLTVLFCNTVRRRQLPLQIELYSTLLFIYLGDII